MKNVSFTLWKKLNRLFGRPNTNLIFNISLYPPIPICYIFEISSAIIYLKLLFVTNYPKVNVHKEEYSLFQQILALVSKLT